MIKDAYALMTGLFVVLLGTAMVAIGLFLGDYGRERDIYELTTTGTVSGLNPESEVIYRGVKAGKVTTIRFDPDNHQIIRVRIEVDTGLPITRGTYATLRVQPLTGMAQVELNDDGDGPEGLVTDAEHPAEIPIQPSLFDKLTGSGSDILNEAAVLARRLNTVLDDQSQTHLRHAIEMLDQSLTALTELEQQLSNNLGRLPKLDKQLQAALGKHGDAADSVKMTSEKVSRLSDQASRLITQSQQTVTTLNTVTQDQVPEVKALLRDLRETAANFRKLSADLERDPRTLFSRPALAAPGPGEPGFMEPR